MNELDIICKCGHTKKEHRMDYTSGTQGCRIYIEEFKWCGCYNYHPDNLLHIEQLAKRKGLV